MSLFAWLRGTRPRRDPDKAASLVREGNALLAADKMPQAAEAYGAAVEADPDYADARVNLGFVLNAMGRPADAAPHLARARALAPTSADAHYLSGIVAEALGDKEAARQHLAAAVACKPDFLFAWRDLCRVSFQTGHLLEARRAAEQGLALDAESADLHFYLGNVCYGEKDYAAADRCFQRALALAPGQASVANSRALVLHELGRHEESLALLDQILSSDGSLAEVYSNRGKVLLSMERPEEALESFERALAIDPTMIEAQNGRGLVLHHLGRIGEAVDCYERALAMDPQYANAHWNLSLSLLLLGDFERGWEEYEWRWLRSEVQGEVRSFDAPLWLGDFDLQGRTLLLHGEQGLGDTIQFCRFVERVAAKGARIVLEVQPALVSLLGQLPGIAALVPRGAPLPAYDCHCPLMSLPLALGVTPADVSGKPYLAVPSGKLEEWRSRLGLSDRPRVGLVWTGSRGHKNDRNRSIPFQRFRELLVPGIEYVCLQKEIREADRTELLSRPDVRSFDADIEDFNDTAALVAMMDLVVTVDTSVAHLAGALGKDVWVLIHRVPDWRWLLERDDSPWYDSVRLFRQHVRGDWQGVLDDVKRAMAERFSRQAVAA